MPQNYVFLSIVVVLSVYAGKINHIIVLMEENRSFDHFFGWAKDLLNVNGLNGDESNPIDSSNPNSANIKVDNKASYIANCDPHHHLPNTTFKIFGKDAFMANDLSVPSMCGFAEEESTRADGNYCDVMSMFTPDRLPVLTKLASEFAIMDRFFSSVPGPTWPNRLFALSGTSSGSTATGTWYKNKNGKLFPQRTIYDQITEAGNGLSWANYYNDTPWELMLSSVAHNPQHIKSMEQFWEDARSGSLPSFAWINPRAGINVTSGIGSNDYHPDHDVRAGERYIKDIYEALRASPQWDSILFIITHDEHGGFYDHVPPPIHIPPPGDGENSYPDKGFKFDRLGIRVPTILVSPWIPKGTVISNPPNLQKPKYNSEYDLTSIIATTRKLLEMPNTALTDRDKWAATFEHVLSLDQVRSDCPNHLPETMYISQLELDNEANLPLNELQRDIAFVHAHLSGNSFPFHIQNQGNISSWFQKHYTTHAKRTNRWKKSKQRKQYSLQCLPWDNEWMERAWNVKLEEKKTTISTRHLESKDTPYCLDSGLVTNAQVSVSECYPSELISENRDPDQQWILQKDATLRPFNDQSLCLTNGLYSIMNTSKVFLEPCRNIIEQHWAYKGHALGNHDSGMILFGDNILGLLNMPSQQKHKSSSQRSLQPIDHFFVQK